MRFVSQAHHQASISLRRLVPWIRTRSTRRESARHKLFLEFLEDRTLLSVAPLPLPGGRPNPFPEGPFLHVHGVGPADVPPPAGNDPSTITDFDGFVGVIRISGTGTDKAGNPLLWDVDQRFMQGVYRGVDGQLHEGTFALV
jgi:hypothetical protein